MALGFELSEEQELLRASVRKALARFEGNAEEYRKLILKEKQFPQDMWDALCDLGVMGCLVPEEYGGNGQGLLAMVLALEEMGKRGFGNALMVTTAMDAACILKNGSEELKKRFLPGIAEGRSKFAFALTEPDAGSNTFRLLTSATRDGAVYRLKGQKVFITGADVADHMLVVARTISYEQIQKEGGSKAHGLSLFVVDSRTPGIEMRPIPTRGIEGMSQFHIYFNDVEVPAENLVGPENQGARVIFNSLNPERILASATAIGMSDYLVQRAVAYAKDRKVFRDQPIGAYQSIQHPLAEIAIQTEAARLMTYRAAWSFDRDDDPAKVGTWANMAKYLAAENAIRAADQAIQTLGGYGFSEEYGVIYYWETLRLLRTAPITKEMILNYVAQYVLDLPRSY